MQTEIIQNKTHAGIPQEASRLVKRSAAGLDIEKEIEELHRSPKVEEARRRMDELQCSAGTHGEVLIAAGAIKQAIIDSTKRLQTDLLVIGRSSELGAIGHLRDLTYALVRDSVCPVLSL